MQKLPVFALGMLLFALATNVEAAGIGGVWKSSSGSTITIPPTQDFDIIIKAANGTKTYFTGAWLPQQVGRQFTYSSGGVAAVATVDPANENRITVQIERTVTVWTRESVLANTPLHARR
jgi:hypothetical protein